MALFTLDSLVLRGSVLCDVLALDLRLGTTGKVGSRSPEIAVSMRRPSGYPKPAPAPKFGQPTRQPDRGDNAVVGTAHGAGRPLSRAGVTRRTSPARTAGATAPLGWWPTEGGPAPAVAAHPCRIAAGAVAPASEAPSAGWALPASTRSAGRNSASFLSRQVPGKRHGRTPPGSTTWERGER
jgi:hypothetical protein